MEIIKLILYSIWVFIPAYCSNGAATLSKEISNTHRIDFNKKLFGQPLLGQGKTFEGLFLGIMIGSLVGIMLVYVFYPIFFIEDPGIPKPNILSGFLLSAGAMFGDCCGSFIKRRFKLKRGQPVILLDQLDFVFGAVLFAYPFFNIPISVIIVGIIITPVFHYLSNLFAYSLKIKNEPY